mmetsp:Transcript_17858/g.39583  ORF Transcript_17858/g.39583 Transcript_17858/m.39583 type:complete len:646 (+) Transcript_17858:42-1979(+)
MISAAARRPLLGSTVRRGLSSSPPPPADDWTARFSRLRPSQAAELEDELAGRLAAAADGGDGRLYDPVLGATVTRRGLDWVGPVTVPSSLTCGGKGEDCAVAATLRPTTLLHPRLDELARGLSDVVRDEMAGLIGDRPGWFDPDGLIAAGDVPVRVDVRVRPQPASHQRAGPSASEALRRGPALDGVGHFLAVYSCKGGVGKSTVAANLAYELSSRGARVGLLDADVHGPSLPLLVRPADPAVRRSDRLGGKMVEPIEHGGVRLMSLGFVSPDSGVPGSGPGGGAAVLRGPMAGRVVSQLLRGTDWGDLDVLVLDMPPGTGDVQLEVCQSLSLSGAVAVSTPSSLAWADVEKGVSMFDEMGVRTVALVENMSYFVCEGGGRHYPFGRPRGRDGEVAREDGGEEGSSPSDPAGRLFPDESRVFRLPISTTLNECNDSGTPLCSQGVADGDDGGDAVAGEERRVFAELAEAVATDLVLIQHGRQAGTTSGDGSKTASAVRLEEAGDLEFDVPFTQLAVDNESESFTVRLFSGEGGYQKTVPGAELRRRDPRTGDVDDGLARSDAPRSGCGGGGGGGGGGATKRPMVEVHRGGDAPTSGARLFPASVTKKGNYGYEVEWADGATYIYSLWALARTAGAVRANGDDQSI